MASPASAPHADVLGERGKALSVFDGAEGVVVGLDADGAAQLERDVAAVRAAQGGRHG